MGATRVGVAPELLLTVDPPTVEQRFLTYFREVVSDDPGLVLDEDGVVWLVEPDGSRVNLSEGAGGGLPSGWTQAGDPATVEMNGGQIAGQGVQVTSDLTGPGVVAVTFGDGVTSGYAFMAADSGVASGPSSGPAFQADGSAGATRALDAAGLLITSLGDPVSSDDAATKGYVDSHGGLPTGWTQDASDPANVQTNGGDLFAHHPTLPYQVQVTPVSIAAANTDTGAGAFLLPSGQVQAQPETGVAAFLANGTSGGTVALDTGDLNVEVGAGFVNLTGTDRVAQVGGDGIYVAANVGGSGTAMYGPEGMVSQPDPDEVAYRASAGSGATVALYGDGMLVQNILDPVDAQDAATKNYVDTHGGGGGGWETLPVYPATWYPSIYGNQNAKQTANGEVYLIPYLRKDTASFDAIGAGINVAGAGSAGSVIRFGIYLDNGSGHPGALVVDAGTAVSTASGTMCQVAITETLTGGQLYWIAMVAQGAPVTSPKINGIAADNLSGWSNVDMGMIENFGIIVPNVGWLATGVAGALPDPLGSANIFSAYAAGGMPCALVHSA